MKVFDGRHERRMGELGLMIVLAALSGCAPSRSELKPALSAADSGNVLSQLAELLR